MPKVSRKGGRRMDASELVNFQYDRPAPVHHPDGRSLNSGQSHRPILDPAVSKRAYMLQNFQFLLQKDAVDVGSIQLPQVLRKIREGLKSSDALPPWSIVRAVVVRWPADEFHCTLCLEMPAAARITECGHVYCLPCVLHYLSFVRASGKQRVCAVCHEYVAPTALRPCILHPVLPLRTGGRASFTLLRRESLNCTVLRGDDSRLNALLELGDDELLLPIYGDISSGFSRCVFLTPDLEETLQSVDCAGVLERIEEAERQPRPLTLFQAEEYAALVTALDAIQKGLPPAGGTTPPLAPRPSPLVGPLANSDGKRRLYEMYGETEGQPYFMHVVNVRMLRHDAEARGWPDLPLVVEAPILDIECFTQCATSRKNFKAFSHIPLQGSVSYCFLDLRDVVLPATMNAFAETLARYDQRRLEKKALTDQQSNYEDITWQEYARRYRVGVEAGGSGGPPAEQSPDMVGSNYSFNSERMPSLDLPPANGASTSDSGATESSSHETHQRATKRDCVDPPINRWAAGSPKFGMNLSGVAAAVGPRAPSESMFPSLEDAAQRNKSQR